MLNFKNAIGLIIFIFLLFSCPGLIKETRMNVYAMASSQEIGHSIGSITPSAACAPSNQGCAGACSLCGCGMWDQVMIMARFGTSPNLRQAPYLCKMPSFIEYGCTFMPGAIVMGLVPATGILTINDGFMTNLQCYMGG